MQAGQTNLRLLIKLLLYAALWWVAGKTMLEVYAVASITGAWFFGFSLKWGLAFLILALTLIAALILLAGAFWFPERLHLLTAVLIAVRPLLKRWGWLVVIVMLFTVVWFFFINRWAILFPGPYLKLVVLIGVAVFAAYLWTRADQTLISPSVFLFALSGATALFFCVSAYARITSFPFSLYWSEGNRFYDYSLVFGQSLYDYTGLIVNPYASPGRYALWGLPFLIDGLSIKVHRAWDSILYTVPLFIVAWMLFRKTPSVYLRWTLIFSAALFLNQGPIYPHFIVPAIIAVAFAFSTQPLPRGIAIGAAGLLASFSRWTWALGPGVWGALIDLILYYPKREGTFLKRLLPTVIYGLIGSLPGVALTWLNVLLPEGGTSISATQQPLLWYRLWPNPNYPAGVVLAIIIASGPLLAALIWSVLARRLKLDLFQIIGIAGALLAFLLGGLVISVKIGGGNNLHNLDLFLFTLILIVALLIKQNPDGLQIDRWSRHAQAALFASLILLMLQTAGAQTLQVQPHDDEVARMLQGIRARAVPLDEYANTPKWLLPYYRDLLQSYFTFLPDNATTQLVLDALRLQVEAARPTGEVLFIDQRQLLTFGYIRNVPFVPEYEKKYMTDQAMAENVEYFKDYYRDLAAHRFSLIVSDALREELLTGVDRGFAEENDAWVKWVSEPTLCFYEPATEFTAYNLMLLVPRKDQPDCLRYLQP